jgi:predicted AAA+ superfamily ATPase
LNKINYVFLDEIQEIKDFEKCVITLFEHKTLKFDIYITGSNSHMFSSELITLFTGRVKEIITFPFSFKEINQNFLPKENSLNENFKRYIMLGGLGIILNTYNNKDECYDIIETVYNSILKKDLINRHKIKHLNNIEKISKFIFNHIGKNLSINNIENFLISNKEIKINNKTLLNYLKYLEEVYLITKVNFYDTVGKKILLTKAKYYAADLGILSVNTKTDISYNYGYRLENLVLLKLLEEK